MLIINGCGSKYMEQIRTIVFIIVNILFGLFSVGALLYLIRARIMLSKRSKILTSDKVITQRRHYVFAIQGLLVLVIS
jgi:phage shock protein PspC (stress-responsive transcriptional regulator)